MQVLVTIRELIECVDPLRRLSMTPLRAKGAYQVGKVVRAADVELAAFETARKALVQKFIDQYGDESLAPLGEDATDEEKAQRLEIELAFSAEMDELLSTQVSLEVPGIDWEFIESVEIAPANLMKIERFVVFQ